MKSRKQNKLDLTNPGSSKKVKKDLDLINNLMSTEGRDWTFEVPSDDNPDELEEITVKAISQRDARDKLAAILKARARIKTGKADWLDDYLGPHGL